MGSINNTDELNKILSLVQENMPRTIVRTGRQPLPQVLEGVISDLAEGKTDPPEKNGKEAVKAAKEFMEAEVDADAAAAIAKLFGCIRGSKEEKCVTLRNEINSFMRIARSIYLAEMGNLTQNSEYDDLIDEKIFIERMIRAQDPNGVLIARYRQTIETVMDDDMPEEGVGDYMAKCKKTGKWLLLTYKKLIDRCEVFLKKENSAKITDDEKHIVSYIRERSEHEQEVLKKILSEYEEDPGEFSELTWGDAIEKWT